MTPFAPSRRSSSSVVLAGSSSQKTRHSRTRRAMRWLYCEPKSRMAIISRAGGAGCSPARGRLCVAGVVAAGCMGGCTSHPRSCRRRPASARGRHWRHAAAGTLRRPVMLCHADIIGYGDGAWQGMRWAREPGICRACLYAADSCRMAKHMSSYHQDKVSHVLQCELAPTSQNMLLVLRRGVHRTGILRRTPRPLLPLHYAQAGAGHQLYWRTRRTCHRNAKQKVDTVELKKARIYKQDWEGRNPRASQTSTSTR